MILFIISNYLIWHHLGPGRTAYQYKPLHLRCPFTPV